MNKPWRRREDDRASAARSALRSAPGRSIRRQRDGNDPDRPARTVNGRRAGIGSSGCVEGTNGARRPVDGGGPDDRASGCVFEETGAALRSFQRGRNAQVATRLRPHGCGRSRCLRMRRPSRAGRAGAGEVARRCRGRCGFGDGPDREDAEVGKPRQLGLLREREDIVTATAPCGGRRERPGDQERQEGSGPRQQRSAWGRWSQHVNNRRTSLDLEGSSIDRTGADRPSQWFFRPKWPFRLDRNRRSATARPGPTRPCGIVGKTGAIGSTVA
jgi:hypothetical protein